MGEQKKDGRRKAGRNFVGRYFKAHNFSRGHENLNEVRRHNAPRDESQNPDVQYYFIMGADSLFHIEKWKDPEIIFQLSTLICMVRDDYNMADIKKKGAELAQRGADILYLNMPKIDISSTDIRNRVKLHQSISELVPEKVEKYILQEHLYEKEY